MLSATLFEATTPPKAIVLLTPGLGIPQSFYFKYANYLRSRGYHSLVFDFRGIGEEHLKSKDQDKINLRNWALQDMNAVLVWMKETYPKLKKYGIFHSIGGQIFGMVKHHQLLDRVLFLSTVGGYWRNEKFPINLFTCFMWYIHIPLLCKLFGHLPRGLTYRGKAIAKGVAEEWATWGRNPGYISAFLGKSIPENYYSDIKRRIDALWFTDDKLMTPRAMASVYDLYSQAEIEMHPINPADYSLDNIAHSGFYFSKSKEKLWQLPLEYLEGFHD